MICEINRRHAVVIELLQVGAALPKDPITECWHTLLLARIVFLRPYVVLIGWQERDGSLLELREEHLLVLVLWVLACCLVVPVESEDQVILVK